MKLYEDDLLLTSGNAAWGRYHTTSAAADYRLDLQVRRTSDSQWTYSTRTDTSWRFRSSRPDAGETHLPLLQVDYDAPVGRNNRAAADGGELLGLSVGYAGRPRADVAVRSVAAWASYDDGATWRRLDLRRDGDTWWNALPGQPRDGYVSLRVSATDHDGNSVEQTVLRAYGIGAGS